MDCDKYVLSSGLGATGALFTEKDNKTPTVKHCEYYVWNDVDRPQSLFDSYLKNFTAKLDWLVRYPKKS